MWLSTKGEVQNISDQHNSSVLSLCLFASVKGVGGLRGKLRVCVGLDGVGWGACFILFGVGVQHLRYGRKVLFKKRFI